MRKLGALFAITLPLLCAASQQPAYRQDPTIPTVWILRKIAFESSMSGFMGDRINKGPMTIFPNPGDISVILAPDWKPVLLAQGQAPAWSPDGTQLAYCTVALSKSSFGQIQLINADRTGQTQLTNVKDGACFPDWSPDSEKIAFTAYVGKVQTIATISRNGENYREITNGYDPRWSPDGKQLLFYRDHNRRGIKRAIWVVNADGTGAKKIIEENSMSSSWVAGAQARFFDGNRIIFAAGREHGWSIYRVNLDGTNLEKFAENNEFDLLNPVLSPEGSQLIAEGVTKKSMTGSRSVGEVVMLSLDVLSKQWTRIQYGVCPSAVWERKSSSVAPSVAARVATSSTAIDKSLVAQGRTRYLDYKCDECHGANGEGGGDGPDLIGTRLNADEISKFLEKPSPDAYMKGMPNIPANHPDNQPLVAYVLSLKRQPEPASRTAQPPATPTEEQQKNESPVSHKLSAAEKAHVVDGDFTIEYKVDRLPDSLKAAFARLAKMPEFKMAHPGEKFEATDVVTQPGLPGRRLIFAGISKNRYFIHYEHGGRGYNCAVVVFDVNSEGKVSFLGSAGGRAKDLAQLRALVSSKAFGDSDNYW